jgi:NTP pyrophosphatase (non-canonical NTP hydrolase)
MKGLNKLAKQVYLQNKKKGFWDNPRNTGETLMLIVSELAEALEAHRSGNFCTNSMIKKVKSSKNKDVAFLHYIKGTYEEEIADTFIRLLDLCGGEKLDIEFFIEEKLNYNKTRPYKHGKKY